ncbi:hypothetical protein B0H14DRAFT_2996528 [Mycena olivaceomarginata]|nr:hypothetical protein B0H14DRAFT_2996528 [Mycena olivaceomarginata]
MLVLDRVIAVRIGGHGGVDVIVVFRAVVLWRLRLLLDVIAGAEPCLLVVAGHSVLSYGGDQIQRF